MTTATRTDDTDLTFLPHETFGHALRRLRRARGLTLRGLDELSGISYSYISMLEMELRQPSAKVIEALADALGLLSRQRTHLYTLRDLLPPGDWSIEKDGSLTPR